MTLYNVCHVNCKHIFHFIYLFIQINMFIMECNYTESISDSRIRDVTSCESICMRRMC